jgi:hypothetical protein
MTDMWILGCFIASCVLTITVVPTVILLPVIDWMLTRIRPQSRQWIDRFSFESILIFCCLWIISWIITIASAYYLNLSTR